MLPALLVSSCVLGFPCSNASPRWSVTPGEDSFLSRAVFADSRLWVLTDQGQLSSLREQDEEPVLAELGERVLDVAVQHGDVVAATLGESPERTWTIRRRIDDCFEPFASIPASDDEFVALADSGSGLVVVTSHRILEIEGFRPRETWLSPDLHRSLVTCVHVGADEIHIGLDCGEWGGGLLRIDRKTGQVSPVERNATGDLCGGPLNTECDPVTGIVPLPWDAGRLAVTIGLVHFEPHGRIVSVKGDEVKMLYSRNLRSEGTKPESTESDDRLGTEAFFGLVRSGTALCAVGIDGIYRLEGERPVDRQPLPEMRSYGSLSASFAVPGLVLVYTDVNQRAAISGSVPLLVAR